MAETRARATANLVGSLSTNISGDGSITGIVEVTQAEYDALTPDANTLYVVIG